MISEKINFPNIDPVFFSIGPLEIRYYGLAYVLGILLAWIYVSFLIKKFKLNITKKDLDDFVTYSIIGIIIGGRLGYVLFYDPLRYLKDPVEIFKTYMGGMSFHGGLAGLVAAAYIFSRLRKINFFVISDLAAASSPIGLFLGRLANFINAELYGRPTDLPWGVVFPGAGPIPRHPSQLYEAFLEGILLFFAMVYFTFAKKCLAYPSRLASIFLIIYSIFRIFVENLREADIQIGYILGYITMGQILSSFSLLLGLYLLARSYARRI